METTSEIVLKCTTSKLGNYENNAELRKLVFDFYQKELWYN